MPGPVAAPSGRLRKGHASKRDDSGYSDGPIPHELKSTSREALSPLSKNPSVASDIDRAVAAPSGRRKVLEIDAPLTGRVWTFAAARRRRLSNASEHSSRSRNAPSPRPPPPEPDDDDGLPMRSRKKARRTSAPREESPPPPVRRRPMVIDIDAVI